MVEIETMEWASAEDAIPVDNAILGFRVGV